MSPMRAMSIVALLLSGAAVAQSDVSRFETAAAMRKLADEMVSRAIQLKNAALDDMASQGRALDHRLAVLIASLEPTGPESTQASSALIKSPLSSPKLHATDEPVPTSTEPKPERVSMSDEEWHKLPPAKRAEILQSYHEDFPERWRRRLQAYFLSLGAERPVPSDKK